VLVGSDNSLLDIVGLSGHRASLGDLSLHKHLKRKQMDNNVGSLA
jgi:hypothetical protein